MPNVGAEALATYNAVATGVIDIDNDEEQLPDVYGRLAMLQADHDNTGSIYLVDSVTGTTNGIRLAAGESTPWIPIDNLNRLYAYGSAANQNLRYMVLR